MIGKTSKSIRVGPYSIKTDKPVRQRNERNEGEAKIPTTIQQLGHLSEWPCYKDERAYVAKVMSNDRIGASGKRKQYAKWNCQIKHLTELSSNPHMLQTVEVIRCGKQYILIQDRDSETIVPLAEYILRKTGGKPPKTAPKFLTPEQLHSIIQQLVSAFEEFTVTRKLVHGSIDLHSVLISESPDSSTLRALVDPSEFEGLTRLLKPSYTDDSEKHKKKVT